MSGAGGAAPGVVPARTGPLAEVADVDLLRAHVAGDRDAFTELFHRHRDRLWAVALRTVGDREDAADALQDALLSAHRAAARFRGDSAVTTWLHRIVVNACLDRIRRRQAHPTVPLPDGNRSAGVGPATGGVEPAAPVTDHDTALVVRQALAQLPVEQRSALVLVDVQGYPVAEVARILGVAEGTVKSRCARGRARMAGLLGHLRTPDSPGPARHVPAEPAPGADPPAGSSARPARDTRSDATAAREPTEPAPGAPATGAVPAPRHVPAADGDPARAATDEPAPGPARHRDVPPVTTGNPRHTEGVRSGSGRSRRGTDQREET